MLERETTNDNRSRWPRPALLVLIAACLIGLTWMAGGFGEAAVLLWGGIVFALAGAIR